MKVLNKVFGIFAGAVYLVPAGGIICVFLYALLPIIYDVRYWFYGFIARESFVIKKLTMAVCVILLAVLPVIYFIFLFKKRKGQDHWKDITIIVWTSIIFIMFTLIPMQTYDHEVFFLSRYVCRYMNIPARLFGPNIINTILITLMRIPSRTVLGIASVLLIGASVWNMTIEYQRRKMP